jgi:uncharacterized membrane protein
MPPASHNVMTPHVEELRRKTRLLTVAVIVTNVMGDFSLSMSMHQVGRTVSASFIPCLHALLNPWVIPGVCFLSMWLLSNLALLSWADLSFVLPVTSIAYVLAAILGRVVLHEHVRQWRWMGIMLMMIGATIVGRTRPRTTPEREQDIEHGI